MSWFKEYFQKKSNKKDKQKKTQVLDQLYQIPKKDKGKNMPHFHVLKKNYVHQADLLFLPTDDGYKYLLVVVDANSRITDGEPLKGKAADDVLKGFKKIYKRTILKLPKKIEVDAGSEFKGDTAKWFKDKGISVRVAKTARHRQQGMVERRNQIIGTAIAKRQAAEELLTGESAVHWVDDLPELIKELNKKTKRQKVKVKKPSDPVCDGDSCNLLEIGTKVRVVLDHPVDAKKDRVHGKFRSGDIRWNEEIRTIKEILLKPAYPPMYLLNGNVGKRKVEPVAYTKNQLQVVQEDEEYPSSDVVKHPEKVNTWRIQKILEKKKIKNKWMLKIKWKGWPDATWEPYASIKKQLPAVIKEYEDGLQD